ncbi:hypothetical protein CVT25_015111 [Psilocybe cyanescens]|uniref:Uncharacterized protein n=1 Tax=Psilocybe cyanescens TaxID=93625 RepID=A0A409WUN5_PSICY|nr:hypothetical protein CVT25_015111 [Psilocybe cyanescens]
MFSLFLRERLYIGDAIWEFMFGVIIGASSSFILPHPTTHPSAPLQAHTASTYLTRAPGPPPTYLILATAAHIRHLAGESGCNDGAVFPFWYLAPLYLTIDRTTGVAIRDWFLILWYAWSVTQAENVVVNRDRDDVEAGVGGGTDVEGGQVLVEREKLTESGSGSETIDNDEEENEKQEQGNLAESGMSGDTRVAGGPGDNVLILGGEEKEREICCIDRDGACTYSRTHRSSATIPGTPSKEQNRTGTAPDGERVPAEGEHGKGGDGDVDGYEHGHTNLEWITNNQRVIEMSRATRNDVACSRASGTPASLYGWVALPVSSNLFASLISNSSANGSVAVGTLLPRYDTCPAPSNRRLENIRTTTQSAAGMREGSPSRNVWFIYHAVQGRPGSSGSLAAAPQQASQLQLALADISIGGGGEDDGEEGLWRTRTKRTFRKKGRSVGGTLLSTGVACFSIFLPLMSTKPQTSANMAETVVFQGDINDVESFLQWVINHSKDAQAASAIVNNVERALVEYFRDPEDLHMIGTPLQGLSSTPHTPTSTDVSSTGFYQSCVEYVDDFRQWVIRNSEDAESAAARLEPPIVGASWINGTSPIFREIAPNQQEQCPPPVKSQDKEEAWNRETRPMLAPEQTSIDGYSIQDEYFVPPDTDRPYICDDEYSRPGPSSFPSSSSLAATTRTAIHRRSHRPRKLPITHTPALPILVGPVIRITFSPSSNRAVRRRSLLVGPLSRWHHTHTPTAPWPALRSIIHEPHVARERGLPHARRRSHRCRANVLLLLLARRRYASYPSEEVPVPASAPAATAPTKKLALAFDASNANESEVPERATPAALG